MADVSKVEEDRKAVLELQSAVSESRRQLFGVTSNSRTKENFKRKNELTLRELADLPVTTHTYKAVGRMFMATPLPDIRVSLQDNIKKTEVEIANLHSQQNYLEKQLEKQESDLKEAFKAFKAHSG